MPDAKYAVTSTSFFACWLLLSCESALAVVNQIDNAGHVMTVTQLDCHISHTQKNWNSTYTVSFKPCKIRAGTLNRTIEAFAELSLEVLKPSTTEHWYVCTLCLL